MHDSQDTGPFPGFELFSVDIMPQTSRGDDKGLSRFPWRPETTPHAQPINPLEIK